MGQSFNDALNTVYPDDERKQETIAGDFRVSQATVSRWMNGKSKPGSDALITLVGIAEERGVEIELVRLLRAAEKRKASIPVDGTVGAGAVYVPYDSQPIRFVTGPSAVRSGWRAMEIDGTSLGDIFDGWLVYYNPNDTVDPARAEGKLCLVCLPDGAMMVKIIKQSQSNRGRFSLFAASSATTPPLHDQAIEWACIVQLIAPDL